MSKLDDVMRTTFPHPDHFDPTKFGPDGNPIGGGRGGRKSLLRPEDVEQLEFLEKIGETAMKDVLEFLAERGFKTRSKQLDVLKRFRGGWRPVK